MNRIDTAPKIPITAEIGDALSRAQGGLEFAVAADIRPSTLAHASPRLPRAMILVILL
jgi:hypothetical protein